MSPSPRHRTTSSGSPNALKSKSSPSPTYRRTQPAQLESFFSSRMQREDASVLPVPALVPSGPDSDSDSDDSDSDGDGDAELLGPGATWPLIFPHLSPYSSPKKAVNEPKYVLPAHLAPAAQDAEDRERRRIDALPLTALDVRPLITTVALAPTTCVSCGLGPDTAPELVAFVALDPCAHVLCEHCLTLLINATSNEPPRRGDCFKCQTESTGFSGVAFKPTLQAVPKTPEWRATGLRAQTPTTLSPFRKLNWSDDSSSTPGSSPRSIVSGFPSPALKTEPTPASWPVVRVDNIPWDLSINDVVSWIPPTIALIPTTTYALSIHILCHRVDCRTLNQCYIELPTLAAAHALIRLKNAKSICGRPISVVLSSQTELLEAVFPAWLPGFDGIDAADPELEGVLLTAGDLEGLVDLCALEVPHAIKAPERPFLQLVTILVKLPWHQPEVYNLKLTARILKAVHAAIMLLVDGSEHLDAAKASQLLQIMIEAAVSCPGFRGNEKSKLLSAAGLTSISPPAPPTTPTRTSFSFKFATPPSTPSAPRLTPSHSPSPLRQSFSPARSPVLFAVTPAPHPIPFSSPGPHVTPAAPRSAGLDFGALAESFGLDEEVVKSIVIKAVQQMA